METRATIKYLRIAPRKVRPIINLLRKRYVNDAYDILANINKKGARLTEHVLKNAISGAKGKKMNEADLFITDIRADGGPVMKRFMSRAMGRADRILKRTTHLSVILTEKQRTMKPAAPETTQAAAAGKKPKGFRKRFGRKKKEGVTAKK